MAASTSGPAKVMIIRHGEKLGDPVSDDSGGKHLSLQGSARAAALPTLFSPSWWQPPPLDPPPPPPPPPAPILECKFAAGSSTFSATYEAKSGPPAAARFPAPGFIFATQDSNHSARPVDTITPTAAALGLTINSQYSNSKNDIEQLAKDILTKSDYAGQVILICWHHGTIDTLATKLHGTGAVKWVGTVFDRLWLLDYSQGDTPPIQQFGQELLFTDETDVPSTPW
jgi:hypothetical protein